MSLIRVGLSETENFAEGYDAIFKKKPALPEKAKPEASVGGRDMPAEINNPAKPSQESEGTNA